MLNQGKALRDAAEGVGSDEDELANEEETMVAEMPSGSASGNPDGDNGGGVSKSRRVSWLAGGKVIAPASVDEGYEDWDEDEGYGNEQDYEVSLFD